MGNERRLEEASLNDNSGAVLDLSSLLQYLASKIMILILGAIIGAACGFGYSKFIVKPKYEAVSKIYIVNSNGESNVNLSDLQVGTNLVSDYISLMKNRTMLDSLITDLDLPYDYNQLTSMISVVNPVNTRELNLLVISSNPEEAQEIANGLALKSIEYLPQITGAKAPSLVEKAVFPETPSIPKTGRNTVFGAFIGFIGVLGFYIVRYLTNDSYRYADEIQKAYGVMPLASIPEDTKNSNAKKKRKK